MDKVISRIGNVCAEDHGGGAVVCTDEEEFYLEWTQGLEVDHPGEDRFGPDVANLKLDVFRVQLDEPAYTALSGCGDVRKLWSGVASSAGMDLDEVLRMAKSSEPIEIAGALEMFAQHYGWIELDCYPISLTYAEVEARWETLSAND